MQQPEHNQMNLRTSLARPVALKQRSRGVDVDTPTRPNRAEGVIVETYLAVRCNMISMKTQKREWSRVDVIEKGG